MQINSRFLGDVLLIKQCKISLYFVKIMRLVSIISLSTTKV